MQRPTIIRLLAATGIGVLLAACAGSAATPSAGAPSVAASAVAITLASGSFDAPFGAFEINATGSGADVAGTMTMTSDGNEVVVDLQCSQTAEGGMVLIGGDVTDSTHDEVPVGERAAIALQPGTPADSCGTFLDNVPVDELATFLAPIEGDLELAP